MDFEVFSISGPVGSDELFGGECSIDAFFIEGPESSLVPVICGENSGSHSKDILKEVYVTHLAISIFNTYGKKVPEKIYLLL